MNGLKLYAYLYMVLALGILAFVATSYYSSHNKASPPTNNIMYADDIVLDHDQLFVCSYLSKSNSTYCTSVEEFTIRNQEL